MAVRAGVGYHRDSMMSDVEFHAARAMLLWQIELGADEAIGEAPVDRYAVADAAPARVQAPVAVPPVAAPSPVGSVAGGQDPVVVAARMAEGAGDLPGLREALAGYDHCELKKGARTLVFADGTPDARVMIVGEAPGREEDQQGKPFVGRAGQLLDRMLAAIGLDRTSGDAATAVYITNMLPWRPPQNRDPSPEELSMLGPFVRRHVELADPDILVLMGNHACQGLLGRKGITRLHGQWAEVMGRPAIPMFHPAYLLRKPQEKSKAWADLLSLKARMRGLS
jgi:DNA polymerase